MKVVRDVVYMMKGKRTENKALRNTTARNMLRREVCITFDM